MIHTSASKGKYVRPDELAAEWRCHVETVRRLVRSGALEGCRVASNILILRDAADRYIASTSMSKAA
jgi:excisionase family DNA binding protein